MERVLKRSAQAAKTADKRIAKRMKQVENSQEWMKRLRLQSARKATTQLILDERQRRKEQWERGALAPRYDVGSKQHTYGTIPVEILQVDDEFKKRKPDWFSIKATDRVVVLAGRAKGQVAEVLQVDEDRCMVSLKGILADNEVPEHMREMTAGRRIISRPLSIPYRDVKLVYGLPDHKTGRVRDVIIDKMEPVGREWDRHKLEWTNGQRLIAGTDTIIPWPEELHSDYTTYDDDTTVDLVDRQTFRPQLLEAPMPLGLIDELRSKYSKFRTRFDYESKERIESKSRKIEERKELIKTMRTPLQELAELRAQQKQAKERELSVQQLAEIGKVMAQSRPSL